MPVCHRSEMAAREGQQKNGSGPGFDRTERRPACFFRFRLGRARQPGTGHRPLRQRGRVSLPVGELLGELPGAVATGPGQA